MSKLLITILLLTGCAKHPCQEETIVSVSCVSNKGVLSSDTLCTGLLTSGHAYESLNSVLVVGQKVRVDKYGSKFCQTPIKGKQNAD